MITRRSLLTSALGFPAILRAQSVVRPNILFAIADDQSWLHTSAAGEKSVRTPAFDRVASLGVRFSQAFCASPGCAPSRAAILTGKYPATARSRHSREPVSARSVRLPGDSAEVRLLRRAHRQGCRPLQLQGRRLAPQSRGPSLRQAQDSASRAWDQQQRLRRKLRRLPLPEAQGSAVLLLVRGARAPPRV